MAIRPSSMHYHCPACSWSKTVAPLSDALGPGDFYSACPECGHAPLDAKPAGAAGVATVLADLTQSVEKLWKSLR